MTATANTTAAIGIFRDARCAQAAVREAKEAGFRDEQIGVLSPHKEHTEAGADGRGIHAVAGAAVGAAAGTELGALWALGIAAGFLPGIGPTVAGGLLVSVLASAASGAAVAGAVGALIGLGIPEDEARDYENELSAGRTLVAVQAEDRANEAWAILHRHAARTQEAACSDFTEVTTERA